MSGCAQDPAVTVMRQADDLLDRDALWAKKPYVTCEHGRHRICIKCSEEPCEHHWHGPFDDINGQMRCCACEATKTHAFTPCCSCDACKDAARDEHASQQW